MIKFQVLSTEKLQYNQILQFSNLDEAKQAVIDSEVKNFLKKTVITFLQT